MATIEPYTLASGEIRYRVRYRKPDGKQTDKRGFTGKRAAEKFANTVEVSKMKGEFISHSQGRVLVGELGKQWTTHRTGVVAKTVVSGESTWRVHVEPQWGTRAVGDVKPSEVHAWVAGMQARGTGVATIEKALGLFHQIMNAAVADRLIPRNPCEGVKPPRRAHNQRGYLTHAQVHQLAGEVKTHGTVVLFLAYTGLRWGECMALRVSDVDMSRRRVNVLRAVSEVRGAIVWGNVKTHERRSVPFPELLAASLAEQMEGKNRDDLVFHNSRGHVLRNSNYRPAVFAPAVVRCQRAAERARAEQAEAGTVTTPEFPRVTPHDLRHTAVSLAISAGANVKAIQTMVGHASAAMTLDTYADLFPDDLEAVSAALDSAARASVPHLWSSVGKPVVGP